MSQLFKKLNLGDRTRILVTNAPSSFESELNQLRGVNVIKDVRKVKEIDFTLAFVIKQRELDAAAKVVERKTAGDAIVWFAYPKGSSKNYTCEFNRDTGWSQLGRAGFEGVRMVAIDDDWSAVRFRRVEFIKSMARDKKRAMTKTGKKKVAKKS